MNLFVDWTIRDPNILYKVNAHGLDLRLTCFPEEKKEKRLTCFWIQWVHAFMNI